MKRSRRNGVYELRHDGHWLLDARDWHPGCPVPKAPRGCALSRSVKAYALAYWFVRLLADQGQARAQAIEAMAATLKLNAVRLADVCDGKDGAVQRYLARFRLPKENQKNRKTANCGGSQG